MTERESTRLWSTTAASNDSIDPSIGWAEGQLPSTVNNSARAMMAAVARNYKDTNGSLTTGGSANAYTLTINGTHANQVDLGIFTFKASFTNTGTATITITNADSASMGTKSLRAPGDNVLGKGQLKSGGRYTAIYDSTADGGSGAWIIINPHSRVFYVDDFGAVGNGTTNDYTAIQAALTFASSGDTVRLSNKSYLTNSTLLPPSGVLLDADPGATIVNGQTNAPAVKIGNGTDQYFGGGCRNIIFAGKSTVVGVAGQCGLSVAKVGQFRIEYCQTTSSPAALYDGIAIDTGTQFFYHNNRTNNCTNRGLYWVSCNDIYANSNHSDSNLIGLQSIGVSGVQGNDFTAYNNTAIGFHLAKSGVLYNHFWFIKGWIGDTSKGDNWKVTALFNAALVGCWGSTQAAAASADAPGFRFNGNACRDIALFGCTAVNNNGDGVLVHDLGGASGDDGATGAPVNIQLFGCILGSNGDPSVTTSGNGVGGTGYGLHVDGASKVIVHGGTMVGNATGTYSAAGTATLIIRDAYGPAGAAINLGDAVADLAGLSALGTNVRTWLGTPSGANLASALTSALPETKGGTNQTTYTTGDLLYASASNTLSKLADIATGNALISGGITTAPSWGKVGLTTHVSGTLAEGNGGTNQTTYTTGDILYASAANTLSKLADIATGNSLISGGVGVAPSWGKIGISTHVSGLGTSVATALGVNVGSAGAFVTFNGALGTPSSGTLTSATGLPISTGISGLGTGIATALAVNVGTAGAPVVNGGALGTPSSGVATNLTGTAASLTAGTVTTNANLTGPVTSVGNATSLALGALTNSLSGDVSLNNTGTYFDGPSVAQGTTGTWFASGSVTVYDGAGAANLRAKLWDGTTVIASGVVDTAGLNKTATIALSGRIASPAANIRISVQDGTSTSGKIAANGSGIGNTDSTITVFRIA